MKNEKVDPYLRDINEYVRSNAHALTQYRNLISDPSIQRNLKQQIIWFKKVPSAGSFFACGNRKCSNLCLLFSFLLHSELSR